LKDNNFIYGALLDLKLNRMFFIHLELCYTLHERSFSKINNRGTLKKNHTDLKLMNSHITKFKWVGGLFSLDFKLTIEIKH